MPVSAPALRPVRQPLRLVEDGRAQPKAAMLRRLLVDWRAALWAGRSLIDQRFLFDYADSLDDIWLSRPKDGRHFVDLAGANLTVGESGRIDRVFIDALWTQADYAPIQDQISAIYDLPGVGYTSGRIWEYKGVLHPGEQILLPLWEGGYRPDTRPSHLIGALVDNPETGEPRREVYPLTSVAPPPGRPITPTI